MCIRDSCIRFESAPAFCSARWHWAEAKAERSGAGGWWARRSIRALEMPPASQRKIASASGVDGTGSAHRQPAASRSNSQLKTQRFKKPSGGFAARVSPCGQASPAAESPIGHGGNFEGHDRACGPAAAGPRSQSFPLCSFAALVVILFANRATSSRQFGGTAGVSWSTLEDSGGRAFPVRRLYV